MIQLIKRHDGRKAKVTQIEKGKPQISINSDGHFAIRVIHDAKQDTLIVLDQQASDKLLSFMRSMQQQFNNKGLPW